MSRQFRQRRFGSRKAVAEDINPSAYIVNLTDCMLVLALGVIVAFVAIYNLDLTGVAKLNEEDMTQVDPTTLPDEMGEGGSYYVEAGTVYMDPNTGQLYIKENEDLTIIEESVGNGEVAENNEVAGPDGTN